MNKLFVLLFSILLLAFAPLAGAGNLVIQDNPSFPDPTLPSNVVSPGVCTLIDGNGGFSGILTANALTVSTPSVNGNAVFKCRGKVTGSTTTKGALRYDITSTGFVGVQCNIFQDGVWIGSTDDWHEEVSAPSGSLNLSNANLTCIKH